MRTIRPLLAFFTFALLAALMNCGPKDKGKTTVNTFKLQAARIVKDWVLVNNNAYREGSLPSTEYNGLTLMLTGDETGGTATTNINTLTGTSESVWPITTNWSFSSQSGDTANPSSSYVLREEDGIVISISEVTDTKLWLSFNIPEGTAARTLGIDGDWTFIFQPL